MYGRTLALLGAAALAACAAAPPPAAGPSGVVGARLGATARVGAVSVRPTALVEESRCPADAMCVHQGTVRVAAELTGPSALSEQVLTLGRPVAVAGRWITLAAACPYPLASQPRPASAYRFIFSVAPTPDPPAMEIDYCA